MIVSYYIHADALGDYFSQISLVQDGEPFYTVLIEIFVFSVNVLFNFLVFFANNAKYNIEKNEFFSKHIVVGC